MKSIGEFFHLLFLFFLVKARQFREELKIRRYFYGNPEFRAADQALCSYYFTNNPYRTSKSFLQGRGEKNIHVYGETPLTTLNAIAQECGIAPKDHVIELGAGTGRSVFFLATHFGCHVTGIEWIPAFAAKAEEIKFRHHVPHVNFVCEDMFEADFSKATVVYLYGTTLDDLAVHKLLLAFKRLPKSSKVISVSYPLTDYSEDFVLHKEFTASYPWGKAQVFLQQKK